MWLITNDNDSGTTVCGITTADLSTIDLSFGAYTAITWTVILAATAATAGINLSCLSSITVSI
jgi:hypothetical protein